RRALRRQDRAPRAPAAPRGARARRGDHDRRPRLRHRRRARQWPARGRRALGLRLRARATRGPRRVALRETRRTACGPFPAERVSVFGRRWPRVGWIVVVLAVGAAGPASAVTGNARELVVQADQLRADPNESDESTQRAIALYQEAAELDPNSVEIQLKLAD